MARVQTPFGMIEIPDEELVQYGTRRGSPAMSFDPSVLARDDFFRPIRTEQGSTFNFPGFFSGGGQLPDLSPPANPNAQLPEPMPPGAGGPAQTRGSERLRRITASGEDTRGGASDRLQDQRMPSRTGPLSFEDQAVLAGLGMIPGFGLATSFTQAADLAGLQGYRTSPTMIPGTPEYEAYISMLNEDAQQADIEAAFGEGFVPPTDQQLAEGTRTEAETAEIFGSGFQEPSPEQLADNTRTTEEIESAFGSGFQEPTDAEIAAGTGFRSRDREEGGGGGGGGGGGCFPAGTKILMADGSQKPIETIVPGDTIMAFDETSATGPLVSRSVTKVHRFDDRALHEINLQDHSPIRVTGEHPFMQIAGVWKPARDLASGDQLVDATGNVVSVLDVTDIGDTETVFTFEVEGLHTYVAEGLRVHNKHSDSGGGGFGCFVAGTQVSIPEGMHKSIDQIVVGEFVMAFDETDPTSDLETRKVLAVHRHEDQDVRQIYVSNHGAILVTDEHPFMLADGSWKKAAEIVAGDALADADGGTAIVLTTKPRADFQPVFNLEVEARHTYVAQGIRVHNIKHHGGMIKKDSYHAGGELGPQVVSDGDMVPDEEIVSQQYLEGETVMNRPATQMFGPLLQILNDYALQMMGGNVMGNRTGMGLPQPTAAPGPQLHNPPMPQQGGVQNGRNRLSMMRA